jgi:hypothetical protein
MRFSEPIKIFQMSVSQGHSNGTQCNGSTRHMSRARAFADVGVGHDEAPGPARFGLFDLS